MSDELLDEDGSAGSAQLGGWLGGRTKMAAGRRRAHPQTDDAAARRPGKSGRECAAGSQLLQEPRMVLRRREAEWLKVQ